MGAAGRVGRVAGRVSWLLAALGLVALGGVELGAAALAAAALPGHGGGVATDVGTVLVALLLVLAGLLCLLCAPSCAPRAIGRRRRPGRSRLPLVLLGSELAARVVAGALLLAAALEAHEASHLWFTRGGGTGPLLARVAVHPVSLIAAAIAAAAISRRWSRLVHAAARARAARIDGRAPRPLRAPRENVSR